MMKEKCTYCGFNLDEGYRCPACNRISLSNYIEIKFNKVKNSNVKENIEEKIEIVKEEVKEEKINEKVNEKVNKIKNLNDNDKCKVLKYISIALIIFGALHILSAWVGFLFGDYIKVIANYLGLIIDAASLLIIYLYKKDIRDKEEKNDKEKTFSIPILKKSEERKIINDKKY